MIKIKKPHTKKVLDYINNNLGWKKHQIKLYTTKSMDFFICCANAEEDDLWTLVFVCKENRLTIFSGIDDSGMIVTFVHWFKNRRNAIQAIKNYERIQNAERNKKLDQKN